MHKYYFKEELLFPFEETKTEEEQTEQKIKDVKIIDKMMKSLVKNTLTEIFNSRKS